MYIIITQHTFDFLNIKIFLFSACRVIYQRVVRKLLDMTYMHIVHMSRPSLNIISAPVSCSNWKNIYVAFSMGDCLSEHIRQLAIQEFIKEHLQRWSLEGSQVFMCEKNSRKSVLRWASRLFHLISRKQFSQNKLSNIAAKCIR